MGHEIMFLTSDEKRANGFKPDNLKYIHSNFSYFSFKCELDPKIIIDDRINYKSLSLHLPLKPTQYIYYPYSGSAESLFPPIHIIQK